MNQSKQEKMTAEEIINALFDQEIGPEEMDGIVYSIDTYDNIDGVGTVKLVQKKAGSEDEGSDVQRVYHFTDHDVFLKTTGFYSSYEGIDWENYFTEVKPKEKLITVYEKI